MDLIIKHLHASNVFSYKDISIDFTKSPITQLVGPNGVGKTNILNTLMEGLFGKNPRGYKKAEIPNNLSNSADYSIQVEFSVGSDEYCVDTVRKGAKLNLTLLKNGEDISEHTAPATYKLIENIIGADYKLVLSYIYQSSTTSLEILTATDSARRGYLVNLLNATEYAELAERLKAAAKIEQNEITKISGAMLVRKKIAEDLRSKIEQTAIQDVSSLPVRLAKVRAEAVVLSDLINQVSARNKELNDKYHDAMADQQRIKLEHLAVDSLLKNSKATRHDLQNRIARLDKEIADYASVIEHEVEAPDTSELAQLKAEAQSTLQKHKAAMKSADATHKAALARQPKSHCHACGQSMSAEVAIEQWRKEVQDTLLVLDTAAKELIQAETEYTEIVLPHISNLETKLAAQNAAYTRYYSAKLKHKSTIADRAKLQLDLVKCESDIESALVRQASLPEVPTVDKVSTVDLSEQVATYTALKAEENTIITAIAKADKDTILLAERTEELEKADKAISEIEYELNQKSTRLALLNKAESVVKGALTFYIEASVATLQELTNTYLQTFSGGKFQIHFKVDNDKLSMVLYNDGKETSFYTASKGQETRIAISVLLAIRNLLDTMSKNKINLLILDEVVGVLDAEGKEQLLEILTQEKNMNIFLVSHEWAHPLFDKVYISKNTEGFTEVA